MSANLVNYHAGRWCPDTYPISTDVYVKMIESHASDLDLYADLSEEGEGVDCITYVYSDQKPEVKIAGHLSKRGREHDLRRTLAHGLAHVYFHGFLWYRRTPFFEIFRPEESTPLACRYKSSDHSPRSDWAESQAEFAAAALLMPLDALAYAVLHPYWTRHNFPGSLELEPESKHAERLVNEVAKYFGVPRQDARKRLIDLRYIKGQPTYDPP